MENRFGGKTSRLSLLKIVHRGQAYAVCGEGIPWEKWEARLSIENTWIAVWWEE